MNRAMFYIFTLTIVCLFFAGCETAKTNQSGTQDATAFTALPTLGTSVVSLATPTETLRPSPSSSSTPQTTPSATVPPLPRLQLTYQVENQIYGMDVGCFSDAVLCFGAAQKLFGVPEARSLFEFSWSWDGQKVVYEYNGDVFVSDWDGMNKIPIANSPEYEGDMEWLPGESNIFYLINDNGSLVYMTSDDTGKQKRVFAKEQVWNERGMFSSPDNLSWSKDGTRIVFRADIKNDYPNRQLFLYDLEKDEFTQISRLGGYVDVYAPAFSPDGLSVIYTRDVDRQGRNGNILAKLSLETGEETVLLQSEKGGYPRIRRAQWSPSGDWICFVMSGDVYLIRPDGSQLINVTNTPDQQEVNVAWRFIP